MKNNPRTLIALIALTASFPVLAADQHSHDQHAKQAALRLNNGKKWAPDAPLKKGMEGIRLLMSSGLPKIHSGKMNLDGFKNLAEKIDQEIKGIFQNCKLEPEADAILHHVLGRMTVGSTQMKTGKDADIRHDGAMEMLAALQQYNQYFKHPGWKPIQH